MELESLAQLYYFKIKLSHNSENNIPKIVFFFSTEFACRLTNWSSIGTKREREREMNLLLLYVKSVL